MDEYHLTSAEEQEQLPSGNAGRSLQIRPRIIGFDDVLEAWRQVLPGRGISGNPRVLHLYLNFPYCDRPCRYCQYWRNCLTDAHQLEAHVDYLCFQMEALERVAGRIEATTAYFGGGTPSLLSPKQWQRLRKSFERRFSVAAEFTSEANPRSITDAKLQELARLGVNRISLGVQSLDAMVLETAGRGFAPVERIAALARTVGGMGMRLNLDLVAGLPGQTVNSFWADLHALLELGPEQLTVYRFKPVAVLRDEPSPELRLDRLFDAAGLDRCARLGYGVVSPEDSHGYAVILFPKNTTSRLTDLRNTLVELWPWRNTIPHEDRYSLFDDPYSHLMGLGPGAFSHVYGRYWLREVTRLDRGVPDCRPIYVGSPVSNLEEARLLLADRLYKSEWVHINTFARTMAADRAELFADLLAESGRNRPLQRFSGGIRIRPGLSEQERRRILSSLLPQSEPARLEPLPYGIEVDLLHAHVQVEIVPFDVPAPPPPEAVEEPPPQPPAAPLARLLARLGLDEQGGLVGHIRFGVPSGARVDVQVGSDGEPLTIEVVEASPDEPAYFHDGRHALRYLNRPDIPLSQAEERFLLALARLMAAPQQQ